MNLFHLLEFTAQKYPHLAAVQCEGAVRTYAELHGHAARLAHGFHQAGIVKGTRVGLLCLNCIEWVEILFALMRVGAVCVPLNWRLTQAELHELVAFAEVRALCYGSDLTARVPWHCAEIRQFICIGNDPDHAVISLASLLNAAEARQPLPEAQAHEASCIIFTAGTTGVPKGVVLTHAGQLWNTLNYTAAYGFAPRERELAPTPLFHASTLGRVFTYVFNAVTFILCRSFDPELCLEIMQRDGVTSLTQTPTQYALLLAACQARGWRTENLRRVVTGAAPMSSAAKQALREIFVRADFFDLYGMTEAGPGIAIIGREDFFRRPASVGQPMLSVEIAVERGQGRLAAAGETGEIVCRSPALMQGYFKSPQETATALRGGWLHTGDIGCLDDEGFLFISGRRKEVIISGGVNIYPGEVESVLMQHPAVQAAAAVGVPDDVWGELVVAAVVPDPAAACTEQDLIGHCRRHLAGFKAPRAVFFLADMPINAAGKVRRDDVRARCLELRR